MEVWGGCEYFFLGGGARRGDSRRILGTFLRLVYISNNYVQGRGWRAVGVIGGSKGGDRVVWCVVLWFGGRVGPGRGWVQENGDNSAGTQQIKARLVSNESWDNTGHACEVSRRQLTWEKSKGGGDRGPWPAGGYFFDTVRHSKKRVGFQKWVCGKAHYICVILLVLLIIFVL